MTRFSRFQSTEGGEAARYVNAAQANAEDGLRALIADIPILQGALSSGVELVATGETTFAHKLGRIPQGMIQTDYVGATGGGFFRRISWDKTTVTIYNTYVGTAAFWVF